MVIQFKDKNNDKKHRPVTFYILQSKLIIQGFVFLNSNFPKIDFLYYSILG